MDDVSGEYPLKMAGRIHQKDGFNRIIILFNDATKPH